MIKIVPTSRYSLMNSCLCTFIYFVLNLTRRYLYWQPRSGFSRYFVLSTYVECFFCFVLFRWHVFCMFCSKSRCWMFSGLVILNCFSIQKRTKNRISCWVVLKAEIFPTYLLTRAIIDSLILCEWIKTNTTQTSIHG